MRRTALLVPLLLLPACGDDGVTVERTSALERQSTPTAAAPTATPTTPAKPTPEPAATKAANPKPSPATAPSKAPLKTAAQGDVDGDGTPDEVSVDENLAVALSGNGRTIASRFQTDTAPQVSGSEDVDRDGRAEVFLRTGQGSSTSFLTPFRYDGRTFAPLTLDGEQVKLGVGGSATHGDGFSCTDTGRLVVRSASSDDDGASFTVTTTTYRVDGHRLVQTKRSTAQAQGMDDPRVGEAYLVDCRSVGEAG
ncbi:MAG: hypothetical protein JWM62_365 [Frankiales bacterium]|nr:hypothetical protein [Frankiales bacterium]